MITNYNIRIGTKLIDMVTVSIEEYLTLALDSGKYSVFLIITVIMNVNRSLN